MEDFRVDRQALGVHVLSEHTASALLWAPLATTAGIKPEHGEIIPMTSCGRGYWEIDQVRLSHGDRYYFVLEGNKHLPDPASLYQPEGVHGPSGVMDLNQFIWSDASWKTPTFDQLVMYEVHTGTFSPQGNFEGIIEKLDYISNLGVTAIELMPVAQFPGERNWGYDGVFPFAVHSFYGAAAGLQDLVDACHSKGMAVILDVVYNHMGPEGNYLEAFGPYFTDKYQTPWGRAMNLDDAWCDGVRRFIIENALMWLRDFHIDGLRLDAVHALMDFSPKHMLREITEQVEAFNRANGKQHFVIGECDLNDIRFINPSEQGGYNLNAQWCDEFHHALHAAVTGEQKSYYADFGSWDHLVKAFNHAYVYDGMYSPHRKKTFGTSTLGQPGDKFVVFSQNHDQVGNRAKGERLSQLIPFELLKVLAGAVILSPFLPLLFMGEEYGEVSPFLYFTSHTNPDLIQRVSEGRKKEFVELLDQEEPPDPQMRQTFLQCKLNWMLLSKARHRQMLSFYRTLIRFRSAHPIYHPVRREHFEALKCPGKEVLILKYTSRDDRLAIVLNCGRQEHSLDPGSYGLTDLKVLINSTEIYWGGGKKPSTEVFLTKGFMAVPGRSLFVLA